MCVVESGPVPLTPVALEVERYELGDHTIVELPLDGPLPSFDAAARYLRIAVPSASVVVAPWLPDRSPPPLESLAAIVDAGLRPGIAVDRVAWVEPQSVWWTTAAGPSRLPLALGTTADRARAATLLARAGDLDPLDPVGALLDAAATDGDALAPADWPALLAARYLAVSAEQALVPAAGAAAHDPR